MKNYSLLFFSLAALVLFGCNNRSEHSDGKETHKSFTGAKGEVRLMTLDPGHFHAALIQKVMHEQMNPVVHVFAPNGPDIEAHCDRINHFNTRIDNPTSWKLELYKEPDFFEQMISRKPGNLMNISGNNAKKTEYILKTVEAGINVIADKPMVISPEEFPKLEKAFIVAEQNGVLLYDVMTERYEITTIVQRALSRMPDVFGEIVMGSVDEPAISKESTHHFFKRVAGKPLVRPAWFFDTQQQGEGLVDVTTHLIDLIQWETFPEVMLFKKDVEIISSNRWTTDLTPTMFNNVTQLSEYPKYLYKDLKDSLLMVYCNGEINYTLKGVHAKASVQWNYQAPEGTKDTHRSVMRGTKSDLIIEQGEKEKYISTLYIVSKSNQLHDHELQQSIKKLSATYPGITLNQIEESKWTLNIPDKYKVGHEAHFGQVTEKYLGFLRDGKLPKWEVPNMITKYHTTTQALKIAK
ncbi:MAG: oxidoreductase [Reichenbachiella sp.]